ncbi:UV radiation resistance-associated gene protein isoform X1 [Trichogramma pretiosum]|uniref:UV radiation resistance-associated gene protein isoform X1 n=1 Tax=Trichogramma pretiosum TaxID=7493 RepID=UPI0006C9AAD5|nr:UV radiation resistance-associated gene protein isoform X1 [Trichogramma pretiosum]XP_014236823.1 UV radiation resistance-associated gene protein isoform X1 [Trichogramma pretiosum]XP_014236824.1 UV radiation resistance-associated gene protein isoform X1 [Trichogramma pretiosum]XP_023315832.1 UV radiation resistance-associated gene protein isoform X1 [Trichogramma pretiosum]
MEQQPEPQCCVKELDLTLQPRIAPRYKTWLPLATQQLRLRNLIQIIGHKLEHDQQENCWYYYTIHRTCMSSPLYTSEPIDNSSPRWSSLEVSTLHGTGHANSSEIILRLWKRTLKDDPSSDVTVFTWGISFTGLAYISPKLPNDLDNIVHDNTLIFHIHGGFFVPPFCLLIVPEPKKLLTIKVNAFETRDSYTLSKLCNLRNKMQALKKQTDSVNSLKEKIASGESLNIQKYPQPQSKLNRLLQPKKVDREKKAEILKIKKDLEIAKFRTKLLEQERIRKMGEIRTLNQCHSELMEENQDHGSDLMGRYRDLNKEIERLHEWRQSHADTREIYLQTTACLAHRRRQLIAALNYIYPISKEQDDKFLINNVHLPDSEKLEMANDTQVAVALGFVAHTTQMIATFLDVPNRYPIIHYGSRSKIVDHIQEQLPDPNRQFPLFARSKDKLQFNYAVYLLNKNIAQLRWYCGLPTPDLRATLPNLSGLINIKPSHILDSSKRTFSGSSLDIDCGNNKNIPLTPPMHKAVLEKSHKTSRSMSHFKGNKILLGSSLDQGLNQPSMQSHNLMKQSKRICKSEESAIDNGILPDNMCNNSSDEIIDKTIFDEKLNSLEKCQNNANDDAANSSAIGDDDIEIMIPMSISKSQICSDNVNSFHPTNVRQRSSNSISSCEMALSGIIDGEDSSNGNSSMKNEDTFDGVIYKNKNVQSTDTKNYSVDDTDNNVKIVTNTIQVEEIEKGQAICKNRSNSSLDDCDNIQNSSKKNIEDSSVLPLKSEIKCDIQTRQDQENTQGHLDHPCTSELEAAVQNDEEKSCGLEKNNEMNASIDAAKSVTNKQDLTSTEYMDSIRKSSENVYARTKALENKTTSFKMIRPRL